MNTYTLVESIATTHALAATVKGVCERNYPDCRVRLRNYRDGRGLRVTVRRPVSPQ